VTQFDTGTEAIGIWAGGAGGRRLQAADAQILGNSYFGGQQQKFGQISFHVFYELIR